MQIKDTQSAIREAKKLITSVQKEHVIGIYLGNKNEVISIELVSLGTLNGSFVNPRDVFRPALCKRPVVAFILLHNHPTGTVKPSEFDRRATAKINKIAQLLEVVLVDHIIFNDNDFYSFRQNDKLRNGLTRD